MRWRRFAPGRCVAAVAIAVFTFAVVSRANSENLKVDGERAMAYAREVVALGPRPSGSPEIRKLQDYIASRLSKAGLAVERQAFEGRTPDGAVPMVNLIARIPGRSGKRILLTGHYDTKRYPGRKFLGANDAGSSTALLLELANALAKRRGEDEIWIVFFDGEEALYDWTESDSLYGSRHLAQELRRRGEVASVKALINVDMVGDRDLSLILDMNSHPLLREMAVSVARSQGQPRLFEDYNSAVEDDHIPFSRLGIPSLDLIDFSYGPGHRYWHTEEDTIDKLSSRSLAVVGNLVLGMVERLEGWR